MTYPTIGVASDVWSLKDVYKAKAGANFPKLFGDYNGYQYAQSYLTTTSGTLTTVQTAGNLDSVLDSASDGDAILLYPGSYTINAKALQSGYSSDPFRHKNVLIVGLCDDAADVVVTVDNDGDVATRDHGVFCDGYSVYTPSTYRQLAFLTYVRLRTTTTNYSNALLRGGSSPASVGRMVNCYFDNNAGEISWHYDNGGSTSHDLEFIRCTFANYTGWDSSYSGSDSVITVSNALFSGSTDTTDYVDGSGNTLFATVDETNRTYNTSDYSTAGHLYVPNTTAVF